MNPIEEMTDFRKIERSCSISDDLIPVLLINHEAC